MADSFLMVSSTAFSLEMVLIFSSINDVLEDFRLALSGLCAYVPTLGADVPVYHCACMPISVCLHVYLPMFRSA
jgi:hypothetical protein